jgi:hypothetical protein
MQEISNYARNELLSSGKLTQDQINTLNAGKELDVTDIDASLYRWAVSYNQIIYAKEKEEELNQQLMQQAADYAAAEVDRMH